MMQAGQLRKRITVQNMTRVRDDFGQENDTWSDKATVWASLEPLQGREQFSAQQIKSTLSHRVRMRHLPDYRITPRDRLYLAFEQRTFNIQSVADVREKHFELEIIAEEIV